MKNLTIIFVFAVAQLFGQSDSVQLMKIQQFLLDNEGKRVGDGVCFTLVDKAIKKVYKNWRDDERLGGKNRYGAVIDSEDLRTGDLIVLKGGKGKPSHIGIVVGIDENNIPIVAHQNVGVEDLKDSIVEFEHFSVFSFGRIYVCYRPFLNK